MPNFALIQDNVVRNIIVAEQEWVTEYATENNFDVVDLTNNTTAISIGYIRKESSYFPPEEISTDVSEIPPDGTTAATITYTDNGLEPAESVSGTVNSDPTTVALTNGVGSLQVVSQTPNDTIVVVLGGVSLVIEVTD